MANERWPTLSNRPCPPLYKRHACVPLMCGGPSFAICAWVTLLSFSVPLNSALFFSRLLKCETIVEELEDDIITLFSQNSDNVVDKLCNKISGTFSDMMLWSNSPCHQASCLPVVACTALVMLAPLPESYSMHLTFQHFQGPPWCPKYQVACVVWNKDLEHVTT